MMRFVYPPPSSGFVAVMTVIGGLSMVNAGVSEIRGVNMKYSKFFFNQQQTHQHQHQHGGGVVSSKTGMLIAYAPAFLAGAASFFIFPNDDNTLRFLFLKTALTTHFLKRLLEVVFIHKYSGCMAVESMVPISLSYLISTCTMIYAQHLCQGQRFPPPQIDLMYPGIALFLVGIAGNLYHHILLSKLRSEGDDASDKHEYKIPKGGLFGLVICPHYLFEIIDIVGISFISQTLYSFSFTLGTIVYLMGRSYSTRRWYLSKFKDHFPKAIKALIPFIF